MKKSIVNMILMLAVVLALSVPSEVFADSDTRQRVESIMDGDQDYLVFASLGDKLSPSDFRVDVDSVISTDTDMDEGHMEELERKFEGIIEVSNIGTYMYYGENDNPPVTGDNVIISMDYSEDNGYVVKYGIFKVDTVSREHFNFVAPLTMADTSEAMELSAFFEYIHTGGDVSDISINDDGVYYTIKGNEYKLEPNYGIKFIDEYGDFTAVNPDDLSSNGNSAVNESKTQSKWKIVFIIMVLGLIVGALIIKFFKKFDKGYDIQ